MKISKNYIESIINWGLTFDQISEGFKVLGIEVEGVEVRDRVKGTVFGKILSLEKATEKLQMAKVQISPDKTANIITNSKTVKVGDIVAACLPGGKVGDRDVATTTIQGFASEGVMMSCADFGIEPDILPASEREGVWIFPADTPLYTDPAKTFWLSDTILELKITPNHPEWLSIRGLLCEIGLTHWRITGKTPSIPTLDNTHSDDGSKTSDKFRLEIESADDCARYVGVFANATPAPSGFEMRKKLLAAALRPVNNIVDATNLAMYEDGQPTHAFDADKIKSGVVRVARTKASIEFETLDGIKRNLPVGTLMIWDGERPIGIAGIMGGSDSEVSDSTTKIFLESAYFNPLVIAKTSMLLGLRSEASTRFEKGADWEQSGKTADKVFALAGLKSSAPIETFAKTSRRKVSVRVPRMRQILGFDLPIEKVYEGLGILGLGIEKGDPFSVEIPGNRHTDLTTEIDLIEEAVRAVGYDTIPTTFPVITERTMKETPIFENERTVRRIMSGMGLMEANSKMLTCEEELKLLGMDDWVEKAPKILNPMTTDSTLMRPLAEIGVLTICAYNIRQRNMDLGLFEVGSQYGPELRKLTILHTGKKHLQWNQKSDYDYFDLKGSVESLLEALIIDGVSYEKLDLCYLHPYRQAKILANGESIGYMGQLHPDIQARLDVPTPVFVASLDMESLSRLKKVELLAKPTPVYPQVLRDIAILAPDSLSNADLERIITENGGEYLSSINLFDLYVGDFAKENKRSMAYSLQFCKDTGSLAGEEIDGFIAKIAKALESRGASLRTA
jgi:phenylalanyl-tRNA synthetase beta chain